MRIRGGLITPCSGHTGTPSRGRPCGARVLEAVTEGTTEDDTVPDTLIDIVADGVLLAVTDGEAEEVAVMDDVGDTAAVWLVVPVRELVGLGDDVDVRGGVTLDVAV